jgi:hypothetical protein
LRVKRIKGRRNIGNVLDNSKKASGKLDVFISPSNPIKKVAVEKRII